MELIETLKKELDNEINDKEQQILLALIEEIKKVRALTSNHKGKQEELQRLYQEVSEISERKAERLIEAVNKLSDITQKIKLQLPEKLKVEIQNQLEYPKRIEVSNFPVPTKFPDELKLKKPDWFKTINKQDIASALEELILAVKENKEPNLEKYREVGKALAVRLVNRKGTDFYEALVAAMGSFGAGSFPFETANKKAKAALVNEQGRVQIDIVSSASVISGVPRSFEDTNFVAGDSPIELDVNNALGKNGSDGYILNDGDGEFTVAISNDGTNYGDEMTMKKGESYDLKAIGVNKIRITHTGTDSAYRVGVI